MNARRTFLKTLPALACLASLPRWVRADNRVSTVSVPGEGGMIVRSLRFYDLETPVEYFNTWLTPVPHFFVRNHMHEPVELDAATWRLSIGGEVEKPVTLSLAELSKFET